MTYRRLIQYTDHLMTMEDVDQAKVLELLDLQGVVEEALAEAEASLAEPAPQQEALTSPQPPSQIEPPLVPLLPPPPPSGPSTVRRAGPPVDLLLFDESEPGSSPDQLPQQQQQPPQQLDDERRQQQEGKISLIDLD